MPTKKEKTSQPIQTILLIEDDKFLSSMYQTKLEIEGYNILRASDGETGFKLAKQHKPDLILLDIVLPNLSGFEVMEQLSQNSDLSKIPVIFLTNLSQKEDTKKGLKLGAKSYLIKAHYMPSEIMSEIKKFLK